MKALILNNKVVDITEVEFEVHTSMTWMDCTADCTPRWTVVDGVLIPPEEYVDTRGYTEKRKQRYNELNQFEMQFDDAVNGTTTWVDAILAIKAEIPLP